MAQILLDTPCYIFALYTSTQGEKHASLKHKASKRGAMLTSKETEFFMHDYANWHDAMETSYLAGMLWEAHAAPILQTEMKETA
jgi:hypothetical protein